jgi:DNA repair photolyase
MQYVPAKTILSGYKTGNPWFGINYTMNIYRGCSHGCIYCDSRSECYGVDHFDEVRAKEQALTILARELQTKRKNGIIGTGAMSDPYNPQEKIHRLTRQALQLVDQHQQFGLAIATKSDLVLRDLDLLTSIQKHSPVLVKITVTTADDELCHKIEPRVAVSSARFAAIGELSRSGIHTGILLMPVLPFLEDQELNIREIVRLAHEHGAKFIFPSFGVTLRQNQRVWFYQQLDRHFPGLKEKYLEEFGSNYVCNSPRAKELWRLFQAECRKYGILYRMPEIIASYQQGYGNTQLSLF